MLTTYKTMRRDNECERNTPQDSTRDLVKHIWIQLFEYSEITWILSKGYLNIFISTLLYLSNDFVYIILELFIIMFNFLTATTSKQIYRITRALHVHNY